MFKRIEIFLSQRFLVPEYLNVIEAFGMFQNIIEDSRMIQKVSVFSKIIQKVPEGL
jgi:hypothetical protein